VLRDGEVVVEKREAPPLPAELRAAIEEKKDVKMIQVDTGDKQAAKAS
jgi:hypothetical protein